MGIQHLPILLLLLGVAVLVFGPKRLPELGHGLGKAITEFKRAGRELTESIDAAPEMRESAASNHSTPEPADRPAVVAGEASPRS
jgi:sec-independent protein translocase protein TatA